ncbi:MAG TPA: hypothetical protein VGE02_14605 [Gemmatimonadales bacterium]
MPRKQLSDDSPLFPLDVLRSRADRLVRAAREACHQHERCAALCGRSDMELDELRGMLELQELANRLLGDAVTSYEKAAAKLQPDGDDRAWWHGANALWLAAREHVRRQEIGDRLARRVGSDHSAERLTELHVGNELEASAVLSLQQAADAYCRTRPDVT